MKKTRTKTRKIKINKKKGGSNSKMDIRYGSSLVDNNTLTARNTSKQPTISLLPLKLSTLVMYDPDSSTPPSWLHYLVINIPNGDLSKGDVIVPYAGPSPPPGSGLHHYIFEQFAQTSPFNTGLTERSSFDMNQFKQQNNLFSRAKKQFIVNA